VHYLSALKYQFMIGFQYLAPLVPVLGWAAIPGARRLHAWSRWILPAGIAVVVASWTIRPLVDARWMFQPRPQHDALADALRFIPEDVAVCVPETLGPRVAGRRHVERCVDQSPETRAFGGPALSNADYQVFDLGANRFGPRVNELRAQGAEVLFSRGGVMVLRRKP
jgi:hypothetical protein